MNKRVGYIVKILVVRPGPGIVERTLRGPWPPELGHLEKVYKEPDLLFRGLIHLECFSHAPSLAAGTILKRLGGDVEYLDALFEFGMPLTEELNAKKQETMTKYIARGGYDVVGISCTSTLEGLTTRQVAQAAKDALEDVKVVVGGYQATSEALDLMKKIPAIDVIVLADIEPIAEKLHASFNGEVPMSTVPNLVYRENGRICASERKYIKVESEDLPCYDYSLAQKYLPKYSLFVIEASRGCPYNCTFCQERVLRRAYTVKDVTVAVDEIIDTANYLAQFVEPVIIDYSDPLWGVSLKWVEGFCSQLADRRDEIIADKFGWTVGIRVGQFAAEQFALMKKAGCITIGYGVESLSPRMLKMMNKTRDSQKYITLVFDTVEKTLKEGMHAVLLFILGLPGETPSTIEETLDSAKNLPLEDSSLHLHVGLPVALHGTLLNEQIHDPQFVETYGVRVLDEYSWEKAYLPRFSQLFDPSRELSASEITNIFLDIIHGASGIPGYLGNQPGVFKEVRSILEKDQILPEELAKWGEMYRKIITEIF